MIKKISGFDSYYLDRLVNCLIPTLKAHDSWVSVAEIAENPALFVEAVAALGARGYFDDAAGHIRIEFGKDNAAIRYVTDCEIEQMYPTKKVKSFKMK